jgi:hypothetical protein
MQNIAFFLWVCLWPVSFSVMRFLEVKQDLMQGKKEDENDKDASLFTGIVFVIIWIVVANRL